MSPKRVPEADGSAVRRSQALQRAGRSAVRPETAGTLPRGRELADGPRSDRQWEVEPSASPAPGPSTSPRPKDLSVEALRGVAIVLMVMGHVIGAQSDGGLRVSDDSVYRYLYQTLSPMRMPLFTVISGFVYACRPVVIERASVFLTGKARRLLLPLVSVSTIQYLFSVYGAEVSRPRELADIWRIYLFPFDQFWFLQAIALVFLAVFVLELTGILRNKWGWSACLLAGAILYVARPETRFFSIDGWGKLLVFFVLGVGLKRFHALSHSWLLFGLGAIVLVASSVSYQLVLFGHWNATAWLRWITLGCGLGATFMLFRLRFVSKPLARLGGFAFTIYLLHSFGVVAARLLGKRVLGIDQTEILFAICLVLGLALPVLGHLAFARLPLTRRVFLGLR